MKHKRQDGNRGEDIAVSFLEKEGYAILDRNYYCGGGELDIVARDADGQIVFVEVKARTSTRFGEPEESVTAAKMAQLQEAGETYLAEKEIASDDYRYDLVAVVLDPVGEVLDLRHHKGFI